MHPLPVNLPLSRLTGATPAITMESLSLRSLEGLRSVASPDSLIGMKSAPTSLREELAAKVEEEGLDVFGVARAAAVRRNEYFLEWLKAGRHGDMDWLARTPERRTDPRALLVGCRSVVIVGMNAYQERPQRRGTVARYALGLDYHDILMPRLKRLAAWLGEAHGGSHRPFVDASAVMEKPHAASTAIGWQGKNTMLIHRRFGNWLMLGGVLTTLEIEPDPSPAPDRCGSCSRCMDICPTGAITAPYQLDARRCISYLTIEHKGAIPSELREAVGDRLFGCDDCLDVCPWNRWAYAARDPLLAARPLPDLCDMLAWSDDDFRATFRGTPVFRLKSPRWLRNVCVVLGNIGTASDLPALDQASASENQLVAEHAAWAARQIRFRMAKPASPCMLPPT